MKTVSPYRLASSFVSVSCALGVLTSTTLLATGCGAINDMYDLTEEVGETSKRLALQTAILQRQQRQAVAQQTRQKSFEIVRQENPAIEIKFKEAATFFHSFEFQIWENLLTNDVHDRNVLFERAGEEFMLSFRGVMQGKFSDANPLEKKGRMPSLMAFAATMEQVNDFQIWAQANGTGFPLVSMLDLVTEALARKPELDQNPYAQMPGHVRKILYYEDEARYLLELRYNIMTALVIDKISSQHDQTLGEKLDQLLTVVKLSKDWVSKFSRLNAVEISQSILYLKEAEKMRTFLRSIGARTKLNGSIKTLVERLKIERDPNAGDGKKHYTAEFERAIADFKKAI